MSAEPPVRRTGMTDPWSLVQRSDLAGAWQRAARCEQLAMPRSKVLALEHLSCSDGLTLGELAERLGLTSGGVSALADRLERAGEVERLPNPRDARSRLLRLTQAGACLLNDYLEPIRAPIERAVAWLEPSDRRMVERFLADLVARRSGRGQDQRAGAEPSEPAQTRTTD